MKSLCLLSIFAISSVSAIENNAFIYMERLNGCEMQACIIFDGHYYTAPIIEHYYRCPCLQDTSSQKTP